MTDDLRTLADPQPTGVHDPLATRFRNWYLADRDHPFWKKFLKESAIDLGYYMGGKAAWADDDGATTDYDALQQQQRAAVSINQIRPIVKVLTGLERQTRFDLKVLPQGEEDEDDARIMSWLMKWVQDSAHIAEYRSQAFKDALILGMSCLAIEIDYSDDEVHGDIVVGVLKPGRDCIWDGNWERPDLRDANHFLRWRWAYVEDMVAQFPEQADEIRAAAESLHTHFDLMSERADPIHEPDGDAYGSVGAMSHDLMEVERQFYDPHLRRVLVLEGWFPEYEVAHFVHEKLTGKLEEVPDGETARAIVAADPKRTEAIRRVRRVIKAATVLPALHHVLEPPEVVYENDAQDYPFVPVIGERMDDDVRGIIRDLRDPQRVENKRISQAIDLVVRWSKIRRVAEENSLASPSTIQTLDDPLAESTIWYRTGAKPPAWDIPAGLPQLSALLAGIADRMAVSIKQISGINTDLLGDRGDTASGIAIARRQAQGQVIATEFFDNNRWSGEFLGKRLGRRIQQKFTQDEYVRLTNDIGASVVVHLNPLEFKDLDSSDAKKRRQEWLKLGKPDILRDVNKFKYDLVMSEAPATPTARAAALDIVIQVVERAPQFLPVFATTIVKLTDGLPDKHEILQKLEAMAAQMGVPPTGSTGMTPNGMPPGLGGETPGAPPMLPASVPGIMPAPGESANTVQPPPPGALPQPPTTVA